MAQALVTIGVPVYHGDAFLEETLSSIQGQTYPNLDVMISLDGPDSTCEQIVSRFLADSRFKLVVQPERLGWFGNLNWLMRNVSGDFWVYHGQDDRTSENYIEALVEHADRHPEATLVYSDMVQFGQLTGRWKQPSVHGSTAFIRQMTLICEHYPGVAFHGLTRARALALAGGIAPNNFDNVATDTVWIAAVALGGELHRVSDAVYRKRFHGRNVSARTTSWSRAKRLHAWSAHCVNMMEQALRVEGTAHELRLLWLAVVARLTSPLTAHLIGLVHLTREERLMQIDSFLEQARASTMGDVPALLDMEWSEIEALSRGCYWLPRVEMVEIVDFGPQPVRCGQPFEVQPNGNSAIWVRSSRRCEPGSMLRLDGVDLDTVVRNTLLTALVPEALVAAPGDLELLIVRPDKSPLSSPVRFEIID